MDNFQNIEKGIRYMQAQLEYDKTILEYAGIIAQKWMGIKRQFFQ